ncbi:putative membrane protein [Staphylococcus aureus subsp. aureus CIG1176]|nr:Keratin associated protein 18-4 [Staphylococcus aureus]EGS97937.1 hypothetical protein SA21195_1640 [Staphylococcus aureus subsp. aureus 21195]EHO91921.1 hypothetical protein SA21264_2663 [Staphylococcus aureus subsp. aureus 21264]EHQ65774.1 hypothetical protein SA21345_2509 [Staphylococcus aureus subsp. aureus 21345]EHT27056.1 putative membrane protein [Staphylococcus aureus subsp. aureus CIG1242]EHT33486.1 putative membrane protein [Staphylococcus aureus subsp. aureus CIG1605]EHT53768.1 
MRCCWSIRWLCLICRCCIIIRCCLVISLTCLVGRCCLISRLCLCSVIRISLITLSSWLCCTCCRLCCASCWISLSTLVCWLCCWLSLVGRCSWLCCRISLSTSICVRLCIGISWLCWLILCRLILLCCRRCCRVNRYKCNSGN